MGGASGERAGEGLAETPGMGDPAKTRIDNTETESMSKLRRYGCGVLFLGAVLVMGLAGCVVVSPPDGGDGNDNGDGQVDNDNAANDNGDGGDGVVGATADAGADQNVSGGDVVQLDGAASTGPADAMLNFAWSQTAGTMVALTGGDSASPSFTAPNVTETLTFELTVDDGADAVDSDTVDIFVTATLATLFVVNNNASVTSYGNATSLNGEIAASTRLNLGASTSLFQPRSIVVTSEGRLLVSRQNGGIVGYDSALTAGEDTPADIVVEGDNTGLEAPISFAYDAMNDRLYVGNPDAEGGILVFENVSSPDFNGDIAPDRAFGPPDRVPFATEDVSISMTVDAMDLDSSGNLFVSDTSGESANQSRILVFADPGLAEGTTEPVQTFTSTSWGQLEDIVVDANDVFYVVDGEDYILIFNEASTLQGDVAPSATVTVVQDRVGLEGIVLGSDGTGYIADRNNHAVYSYDDLAGLAGGNVPNRILKGSDTDLRSPRQMFLLEQ